MPKAYPVCKRMRCSSAVANAGTDSNAVSANALRGSLCLAEKSNREDDNHARSEVSVHTRAYWSLAFNAERLGNCLLGEGMSLLRIELAVGSCAK